MVKREKAGPTTGSQTRDAISVATLTDSLAIRWARFPEGLLDYILFLLLLCFRFWFLFCFYSYNFFAIEANFAHTRRIHCIPHMFNGKMVLIYYTTPFTISTCYNCKFYRILLHDIQ